MLIKFFPNGQGRGSGPVGYLIADRDTAEQSLTAEAEKYEVGHREIEGLEANVEVARSSVFSVINSASMPWRSAIFARSSRPKSPVVRLLCTCRAAGTRFTAESTPGSMLISRSRASASS